jgi:hypothetical protein
MLHFLLIILALLGIWKLLSHGRADGASLVAGLRRIAVVLAIAGAALGGFIGYAVSERCTYAADLTRICTGPDSGAIVLGIAAGFGVIWAAALILIWIVRGFMAP